MGATATLQVRVSADLTTALDIGIAEHAIEYGPSWPFTDGTGANQVQQVFADTRTLAASGTENLDLSGTLTNAFGATIAFTKVKALVIRAAAANTNDVLVGGAGANACFSFFNASTDKVRVKPGGVMALVAPDANGYAVTAATADLLTVANGGAGTGVTYDVILIGV